MSDSKCPKCAASMFELSIEAPQGSKFRLTFIRCAICHTVIGVMEDQNVASMLIELREAIKEIAKAVGAQVNLP